MLMTSKSLTCDELNIPLLLRPAGKDYLWGGTRLQEEYGKCTELEIVAESWECSTHPAGLSRIVNGPWQGHSLKEYLEQNPRVLGRHEGNPYGIPVLVKLIDADKDLSLQVHPDDDFALEHEDECGKTELWYVLDAAPGAELIYGFSHDIAEEQLRKCVEDGSIVNHVQRIPVCRDDVFFVRPGTIHAIGAGVLLAEIQQSSDVTYRVFDYHRIDKSGSPRPLHVDKAVQVMDRKAAPMVRQQMRLLRYTPGAAWESLCRCPYFHVDRMLLSRQIQWEVPENNFQILLVTIGDLRLDYADGREALQITKGDCVFVPAGMGKIGLRGNGQFLRISC